MKELQEMITEELEAAKTENQELREQIRKTSEDEKNNFIEEKDRVDKAKTVNQELHKRITMLNFSAAEEQDKLQFLRLLHEQCRYKSAFFEKKFTNTV